MTKKADGMQRPLFRTAGSALMESLYENARELYEQTYDRYSDCFSLSVYFRVADVLVVLRRASSDGSPEVLFASGLDLCDGLARASRLIETDAWKPDKTGKQR